MANQQGVLPSDYKQPRVISNSQIRELDSLASSFGEKPKVSYSTLYHAEDEIDMLAHVPYHGTNEPKRLPKSVERLRNAAYTLALMYERNGTLAHMRQTGTKLCETWSQKPYSDSKNARPNRDGKKRRWRGPF